MSNTDWSWGLTQYMQQLKDEQEAKLKAFRELALPALKKHRMKTVVAHYSGYGDSGAVQAWSGVNKYGKQSHMSDWGMSSSERDALENYVLSLLPEGWEIDDGSQGTVTLDLAAGKAEVKHGVKVTSFENSTLRAEF